MRRADDCPSLEVLERFAARALDVEERAKLDAHCSTCVDCRARVDEVASHFELETRLKSALDLRAPAQRLSIDGFRIVRELGRGGMGVVYEAEQLASKRRVALKVVRGSSYAGERTHALFQREIEALARLSHPCIAALFGAGATESGEPWFAMELVDGVPLTTFARTLALRERVALLARIAHAVHHAHQRGVVHRDLKPSNVLVGAGGAPKVLDFGLAKILDDERRAGASQSFAGSVRGTLAYMSPEQARGDPDAIDARSDVYTLGVLLYELLAQRMPYELDGLDLLGAARVICEHEVAPPSRFERAARGDLDAIALEALAKDADARYSSAAALAEDLERWSRGEVVLARRPTGAYVFAKLVARHKLAFTTAAALIALLAGFGAWMSVLYGRADRLRADADVARAAADGQRALAEHNLALSRTETAKSQATLDFLTRMLGQAQRFQRGGDVKLGDVVEQATRELDRDKLSPPQVQASIGLALANVQNSLGQTAQAQQRLDWCLQRIEGEPDAQLAPFHLLQFSLHLRAGRLDEAEAALADAERELAGEPDDPRLARAVHRVEFDRGRLLVRRGRLADAVAWLQRSYDACLAAFGADDRDTLDGADQLSIVLQDLGRLDEAEPYARAAVDGYGRTLSDEHPNTLNAQTNYATLLVDRGRRSEARELLERTAAVQVRVLGAEDEHTLATRANLAAVRMMLGEHEAALAELRDLAATQARALGPDALQTLNSLRNVGSVLLDLDRAGEAAPLLADVVERAASNFEPTHWIVVRSRTLLGLAHTKLEQFEDAESEFTAAIEALDNAGDANPAWKREAASGLVALYTAWRKPDEAERWRALTGKR